MIFQDICQLIAHKSQKELSEYIVSNHLDTLDIFDDAGMHTPLSLFASQGKTDVVNWLMAFDEEFGDEMVNLQPGEAVKGYAMGGYDDEAEKLLDSRMNARSAVFSGYNPFMPFFIHGCAMGGRVEKVNELLSKMQFIDLKKAAINGYRAVGNIKQIDLLSRVSEDYDEPLGKKLYRFLNSRAVPS